MEWLVQAGREEFLFFNFHPFFHHFLHPEHVLSVLSPKKCLRLPLCSICLTCTKKNHPKTLTSHVSRPWPRVCDPMKASEVALVLVAQNAHHHPGQGWRQGEKCHTQTAGGVMPSRFQDQGLEAGTRSRPGPEFKVFFGWFLEWMLQSIHSEMTKNGFGIWQRTIQFPSPGPDLGHFGLRDFLRFWSYRRKSLVYKWHFTTNCFFEGPLFLTQ